MTGTCRLCGSTQLCAKGLCTKHYAALGNSMAVPVLRWLGQRIELIHRIQEAA